jgi:hypothetical protein
VVEVLYCEVWMAKRGKKNRERKRGRRRKKKEEKNH